MPRPRIFWIARPMCSRSSSHPCRRARPLPPRIQQIRPPVPLLAPARVRADEGVAPAVAAVGKPAHQIPGAGLVYQLSHRLLADAGACRQCAEAAAVNRQMAGDLDMRGVEAATRRQVGQRQPEFLVTRHQREHPGVEALESLCQQPPEMGFTPALCVWASVHGTNSKLN